MATSSMNKVKGLYTFQNFLSAVPEGSLFEADNVNIDRDGVIEPRRGIKVLGTIDDFAKQLLVYKDRILAHYNNKIAAQDDNDNTVFNELTGTIQEVDTNLRIKSVEMNSSLYVTTQDGIKKILKDPNVDDTYYITNAGGINALDLDLSLDISPGSSTSGFFGPLSSSPADHDVEVAYELVWGTKDLNNTLILGKPSSREVLTNTTGEFRNVNVSTVVPSEITSEYFFQVYRTNVALLDGSGAEFKLVFEAPFVSGATEAINGYDHDISTNTIVLIDQQPEDLRNAGVPLYTNEFSGEGILQANERPPVSKDIAIYKNITFYSNTRTSFKQELTLLGFDGVEVFQVTGAIPVVLGEATITTTTAHGLIPGNFIALAGTTNANGEYVCKTGTTGTTIKIDVLVGAITQLTPNAVVTKSHFIVSNNNETTIRRYYPVGRPEIWELTVPAKASIVDQDYFNVTTADDKIPYTFWMDVSGTASPPVVANRVLIRVDLSSGSIVTDVEVAAEIKSYLDASLDFSTDQNLAVLTIATATSGFVNDVDAGTVSDPVDWTITTEQDGFGEEADKRFFRLSSFTSPASRIDDTARSLVFVINRDTSSLVNVYYLSTSPNSLPGAFLLEEKTISLSAFKVKANNQSFGRMFSPDITSYLFATNTIGLNSLYFSKPQQPENVPIINKIDIGPKDRAILRILGLRDSLFILKEEAIYRLTGENVNNFTVALFDNSANIIASDTAVVLNNQIYCLTTQGVTTISETGVGIISRPIDNIMGQIISPSFQNSSFASFGISYETDSAYLLFTIDSSTDTSATKCYRYNTFTQSWTSWTLLARCGIVEPTRNNLHIGPSDIEAVEIERKTITSRDFADREFERALSSYEFDTLYVDNANNMTIGDMLSQIQYLTVSEYNRLIKKLKLDPSLATHPDIIALTIIDHQNQTLIENMQDLVAALNAADPGGGPYVVSGSNDFQTLQTEYNVIINQLNVSTGVFFADYSLSSGTVALDMIITLVNKGQNYVEVASPPIFVLGEVTHYKGIPSSVVWAPTAFGEPSISKHIREGTVMIESTALAGLTIGYASDLSGNFEDIEFGLDGSGLWGNSIFQNVAWGGEGISYPIRTLIPRQKQRCRYIKARFQHNIAMFQYAILGISYTYEPMSERSFK